MGYSLSELQEVLEKFSGIEYERRPANFFEIINGNQSHHEKYVSNALAFFLDSSESHGLGTLVLDALLETANAQNSVVVEGDYYVEREKSVDCGGRGKGYIDIFVSDSNSCIDGGKEVGGWAIAIENKVRAPVYNPLKCYCAQARKCVGKDNNPVCILLTLTERELDESRGFHNVTYERLAERVKSKLNLFDHTPSKYTYLLVEFFEHLGTLKRGGSMDRELVNFLCKNWTKVSELSKARQDAKGYVKGIVNQVCAGIESHFGAPTGGDPKERYPIELGEFKINRKPWRSAVGWKNDSFAQLAVVDLVISDCNIAFDTYIYLDGKWELYVFARNKPLDECKGLFARILPEGVTAKEKDGPMKYQVGGGAEMDAEEIAERVWCKIRELITGEKCSNLT